MFFENLVGELVVVIIVLNLQASLILDHPMVHGGMLLVVGVMCSGVISIFCGPLFASFYFLVLVGGVLIVFAYSISLVPYDLALARIEEWESFQEDPGVAWKSVLTIMWVLFGLCALVGSPFLLAGFRWGGYSYSLLAYYSTDWGVASVLIGVLLFLLIVSVVGVTSSYKGALVLGNIKKAKGLTVFSGKVLKP